MNRRDFTRYSVMAALAHWVSPALPELSAQITPPNQALATNELSAVDQGPAVVALHDTLKKLGYTVRPKGVSGISDEANKLEAPYDQYDVWTALAVSRFQNDYFEGGTKEPGVADKETLQKINEISTYYDSFEQQLHGKKSGLKQADVISQFKLLMRETAMDLAGSGENGKGENRGLVDLGIMPSYADGQPWCAGFADYLRQNVAVKLGISPQNLLSPHSAEPDNISVEKLKRNAEALKAYHAWGDEAKPQIGDILLIKKYGRLYHATTIIDIEDTNGIKLYKTMGGNLSTSDDIKMNLNLVNDIIQTESIIGTNPILAGFVDNNALLIRAFNKQFPGRISDMSAERPSASSQPHKHLTNTHH